MMNRLSLLMVIAALAAFAAPAFASAHALTEPSNKLVPVGAKILVTSTNATVKVSAGTLACEKNTATAEVTVNSSGNFAGVGSGPGSGTTCTVAGKAATVSDITVNSFQANAGTTSINLTFKAVIAGTDCHFESPSVLYTYTSGTDSFKITNGDLTGKPAVTCEPGTLNGDFTVETDVSPFTAIILD